MTTNTERECWTINAAEGAHTYIIPNAGTYTDHTEALATCIRAAVELASRTPEQRPAPVTLVDYGAYNQAARIDWNPNRHTVIFPARSYTAA